MPTVQVGVQAPFLAQTQAQMQRKTAIPAVWLPQAKYPWARLA